MAPEKTAQRLGSRSLPAHLCRILTKVFEGKQATRVDDKLFCTNIRIGAPSIWQEKKYLITIWKSNLQKTVTFKKGEKRDRESSSLRPHSDVAGNVEVLGHWVANGTNRTDMQRELVCVCVHVCCSATKEAEAPSALGTWVQEKNFATCSVWPFFPLFKGRFARFWFL